MRGFPAKARILRGFAPVPGWRSSAFLRPEVARLYPVASASWQGHIAGSDPRMAELPFKSGTLVG